MKRYLLFSGKSYYAQGGWHDFVCSFSSLDEAAAFANYIEGEWPFESEWEEGDVKFEWWHVVDTESGAIVAKSEWQAHGAPDYFTTSTAGR